MGFQEFCFYCSFARQITPNLKCLCAFLVTFNSRVIMFVLRLVNVTVQISNFCRTLAQVSGKPQEVAVLQRQKEVCASIIFGLYCIFMEHCEQIRSKVQSFSWQDSQLWIACYMFVYSILLIGQILTAQPAESCGEYLGWYSNSWDIAASSRSFPLSLLQPLSPTACSQAIMCGAYLRVALFRGGAL